MQPHAAADAATPPRLTPASNAEDFLARPFGRYWAGPCYLHWSYDPGLAGSVIWGHPDEEDVRAIVRLWDFGRPFPVPPGGIDVITDCNLLERIDAEVFGIVIGYAAQRQPEFVRRFRRQALVHPAGLTAATMAGVFSLIGMAHAWKLFDDPRAAFLWLERPDSEAAAVEVARIVDEVRPVPVVLRELRRFVQGSLLDARLSVASRTLGRSARALQRELQAAGTSFREVVEGERIAASRRLLLESEMKLEVVARRVGFASLAVFSRMFRRATGEAPGQFRQARRVVTN